MTQANPIEYLHARLSIHKISLSGLWYILHPSRRWYPPSNHQPPGAAVHMPSLHDTARFTRTPRTPGTSRTPRTTRTTRTPRTTRTSSRPSQIYPASASPLRIALSRTRLTIVHKNQGPVEAVLRSALRNTLSYLWSSLQDSSMLAMRTALPRTPVSTYVSGAA